MFFSHQKICVMLLCLMVSSTRAQDPCDDCDIFIASYIHENCCDPDFAQSGECRELLLQLEENNCFALGCADREDPCGEDRQPSISALPSVTPSTSIPSESLEPSYVPSESNEPSVSLSPTCDCTCCNCTHSSGCNGDPHYNTWNNSYYDFQGGCDQIAIDNPIMQVQMRSRPRGYYSAITEVVVVIKSTGEIMRVGTAAANSNTIGIASDASVTPYGGGYQIDFLNAPGSFIRVTNYYGNMAIQVSGDGTIFSDSEGMFGSWNYGGVRFRNGTLYDTTGGWAATRLTSIALAQDWMIPLANNLLTSPSTLCDGSSACGPTEVFPCGATRRLQAPPPCSASCGDINDPTGILVSACEEDVALSGGNEFTCQPAYQEPVLVEADPNDFGDPPTAAPTNSGGVNGDPIILGLQNQVFKFEGRDGAWYSNLSNKHMNWNMLFKKFASCPENENMFVSGMALATVDEPDKHLTSNILIATTPEATDECRSDPHRVCLGEGTLHISLDGGKTFISEPGDYHYGYRSRVVAHNTYAACSRKWHDYEISKNDWHNNNLRDGGRRMTIEEKKPLQLVSDQTMTMIDSTECHDWIQDRATKDDLFQQKGQWSTLYIETPQVSFHVEYRRSDWYNPKCDFQSLDAWMTKVSDKMNKLEWNGILGETKNKMYDMSTGEQITTDRSRLLRGKEDEEYEVNEPFGVEYAALRKNKPFQKAVSFAVESFEKTLFASSSSMA